MTNNNVNRATIGTWLALMTGVAFGLGTWTGSANLSGKDEAWDTQYYFPFLLACGTIGGLLFRNNYHIMYLGTVLGQFAYFVYLLASHDQGGASLWPLGLVFMLSFSFITYFSAWGAAFVMRYLLGERLQSQKDRG
jgi:hypothetical protein